MRARQTSLALETHRVATGFAGLLARELAKDDVPAEGLALLTTIRLVGPLTPSALAAASGYPKPTLTEHIQRLVARGLVERRPHPADRRSHLIAVTDRGEALTASARPAVRRTLRAVESHLDRPLSEVDDAIHALGRALDAALRGGGGP